MSDEARGYKSGQRYNTPDDFLKYNSRYDFSSPELDDLQRRNLAPVRTLTLDLTVAQTPQNPFVINTPGRAFRIKGLTKASIYDPVANAGIETVVQSVFVGCWIGMGPSNGRVGDPDNFIALKHGGGYRGDFSSLMFFWPLQASNAARIEIFTFDDVPWASGDFST